MSDNHVNYVIWPDGRVEELNGNDILIFDDRVPDVYAKLVENGMPRCGGTDPRWVDAIDLRIADDGMVVAHTEGAEPHEHPVTADAALPFTSWLGGNR